MSFENFSFSAKLDGSPENLFKQVLDNLLDGVYFADRERRITYWNAAAERLTGYSAEEVVGKRCADDLLMHVDDAGCLLCDGDCPLSRTIADGRTHRADIFLHHKNGHRVPVEVRVCPIQAPDGQVVGAVEIFNDNSRERAMRERAADLARWAFLDPLSQLPNRRYLEDHLAQQLVRYSQGGMRFGVLLADVDEFKKINDSYGHIAGDAALVAVAKTLSNCLRTSDVLGRWGGDEFLALVPGLASEQALVGAAERCRNLVARAPIPVNGSPVQVTISVGAAIVAPGDTPQEIVSKADKRLYESKQAGRNRVSLSI